MTDVPSKKRPGQMAILLVSLSILLAACGGQSSSSVANGDPLPISATALDSSGANSSLWDLVDTLPYEQPDDAELAALAFMREEEKLARDVYLRMNEIWNLQVFANIANSEQTHTDAVLHLIQKYGLVDPAENNPRGVYSDPNLQGLYDLLLAQGAGSLIDALIVGATIEDLDINDLHQQLDATDNEDIIAVFESLLMGSRNHMRAFYGRLDDLNVVYTPVYINQQEYDEIIGSPMERGQ